MVIALSAHDPDRHITLRPEVKYVGNMHGNEVGTYYLVYVGLTGLSRKCQGYT